MNTNVKLDTPVYIISVNNDISFNFKEYFSNVNIYPAIDTRNTSAIKLFNNELITWRAYNDLLNGRKDHFGFAGIGAIGLYLTYRKILRDNKYQNKNILICEQDCIINDVPEFLRKIKNLNNNSNFDCAVFGANYHSNGNTTKDFIYYKNSFVFTQSILWSPLGIQNILNYINDKIEIQLDSFFSQLTISGKLNLLMETNKTTSQELHESLLQNDSDCKLCDIQAKEIIKENFGNSNTNTNTNTNNYFNYIFIIIIIIIIIYYCYSNS